MFKTVGNILARAFGGQPVQAVVRRREVRLRARYDAAQTTPDNQRYWAAADALSANSAITPAVRRVLRNRSRYEVANNSWANGIVQTLANDCIGTGPRLQMLTGDAAGNRLVEKLFSRWADAVGLAAKLRLMRMARAVTGECFAILTTNPKLPTPVQLDVKLIEADQVADPYPAVMDPNWVDGIVIDDYGNPVEYHVLKNHPGSYLAITNWKFDRVPAGAMVHYFRSERPGQFRGIPDITPALNLFAMLRRYNHAVLAAAETAASYAAVIYTDAPANGEAAETDAMDVVELEHRMATVLPEGWKLGQVHSEHPSTTHSEFTKNVLNEIARCLNMPFNVAAGNSSGYNYSSGRLDHQTYYKSLRVDQCHLADTVLDRILLAWLGEAVLVEGYLPQSFRLRDAEFEHQWFWDGMEHVDPQKEAAAQAQRLASNTTTLAYEYARQGKDWESELRQRAKEVALMEELGLDMQSDGATKPRSDEGKTQNEEEPADAE